MTPELSKDLARVYDILKARGDGTVVVLADLIATHERVVKLYEALLTTLTPSRSPWIQHVVRNARAAFEKEKT